MSIETFIEAMPKVELHVHLEGSIQPSTLLKLARRNGVNLPSDTAEGLRAWYTFTGFPHFIEVYIVTSMCIRTLDDIELVAREFLAGQAAQNVRYSEVTFTAMSHYKRRGLPYEEQLAAINRARAWAISELNTDMGIVIDIPREARVTREEILYMVDWVVGAHGNGVVALGLGGMEVGHPPEDFAEAFEHAREAGVPSVPHAGETVGPESVWGALNSLHADRIGHGVRCIEDPALVALLRERQVPLEVCPTSNVCLGVVPRLEEHPLPRLLAEGLYVTINSDDPPMFNTTLTQEYLASVRTFGITTNELERLVLNAVRATFLPPAKRTQMEQEFSQEFQHLRAEHL